MSRKSAWIESEWIAQRKEIKWTIIELTNFSEHSNYFFTDFQRKAGIN